TTTPSSSSLSISSSTASPGSRATDHACGRRIRTRPRVCRGSRTSQAGPSSSPAVEPTGGEMGRVRHRGLTLTLRQGSSRDGMNARPSEMLSDVVEATAAKFAIPGVAVGVLVDGREVYACHGVTSVDTPLPVDRDTLYVLGSVTKTYTATTLMRLVAQGRVEL